NTLSNYPGKAFDNNYTLNTVDICPVGALTSKDFRFKMRVWFLKETKSICTSCGTGCNIVMGSREGVIHRYEPRENNAVNSSWMCDYGRLNYKWINRADRLSEVRFKDSDSSQAVGSWATAVREISQKLSAGRGSVAIIASARQTNEELYLLKKIADKVGAITDSIPRRGEGDRLLLNPDRNPNTVGSQLIGIGAKELGANIPVIADGIRKGTIKTLIVFGEDVTKHGIGSDLLAKLELLVASDILPGATVSAAHIVLPGAAHAEKRGTFTNIKGRVQRFMKAVEPPGNSRPEWEFLHEIVFNVTGQNGFVSIEGLFNQMAKEVPAFNGLTWAGLGDMGASVPI
ncbi:MAG: molybdopterin-dependent oxidoreductase, partial [Limisphaerales bacterium]